MIPEYVKNKPAKVAIRLVLDGGGGEHLTYIEADNLYVATNKANIFLNHMEIGHSFHGWGHYFNPEKIAFCKVVIEDDLRNVHTLAEARKLVGDK